MSSQFGDPDGRVLVLASEERPYSLRPGAGGWPADPGADHRTARPPRARRAGLRVLLAGACA